MGWQSQVSLRRKTVQARSADCASRLPLLPLAPAPSPGPQAKSKIPTKKEQSDTRCRAKPFPPLHGPSKVFTAGIGYHHPDFRERQTKIGDSEGVSICQSHMAKPWLPWKSHLGQLSRAASPNPLPKIHLYRLNYVSVLVFDSKRIGAGAFLMLHKNESIRNPPALKPNVKAVGFLSDNQILFIEREVN